MALGDINKPKKAPIKNKPAKASNYEIVRDRISKERGISPDALDEMVNKIGYHESAKTMNPQLKQYGGGPGRGIFQFEPDSLKTALNQADNFYKRGGGKSPLKRGKNFDATKYSTDDQKALALISMNERKGFSINNAAKGGSDLTTEWGSGWQTTSDPEKMKNFDVDASMYDANLQKENIAKSKEIIPSTVQDMWKNKYKKGVQSVKKYAFGSQSLTNDVINPNLLDEGYGRKYDMYRDEGNIENIDAQNTRFNTRPPREKMPIGSFDGFGDLFGGGGSGTAKFSKAFQNYTPGNYANGSQSVNKYAYGSQNLDPSSGYQMLQVPSAGGVGNVMENTAGATAIGAEIGGVPGAIGGAAFGMGKGILENRNIANNIGDINTHNDSLVNLKTDDNNWQAMNYAEGSQSVDPMAIAGAIPDALNLFGVPNNITNPMGSMMNNFMGGGEEENNQYQQFQNYNNATNNQPIQTAPQRGPAIMKDGGTIPRKKAIKYGVSGSGSTPKGKKVAEYEGDEVLAIMDKTTNNIKLVGGVNGGPSHGEKDPFGDGNGIALSQEEIESHTSKGENGSDLIIYPKAKKGLILKHIANNNQRGLQDEKSKLPTEKDLEMQQQDVMKATKGAVMGSGFGKTQQTENDFNGWIKNLTDKDLSSEESMRIALNNVGFNSANSGGANRLQDYLDATSSHTGSRSTSTADPRFGGLTLESLRQRRGYLNQPDTTFQGHPKSQGVDPLNISQPTVTDNGAMKDMSGGNPNLIMNQGVVPAAAQNQNPFSFGTPETKNYGLDKARAGLPSMYNLGMGLFGNVEKSARRFFDPKQQKYTDLSPQQKAEALGRQKLMQKNIGNAHMSRGQELGSLAQAQQRYANEVGKINQTEAGRFDRIQQANTNMFNQAGQMNLGLANQYDNIDAQNRGMKQQFTAKGLEGQSKMAQFNRKEKFERDLAATKDLREQQKLAIMSSDRFDSVEQRDEYLRSVGIGATNYGSAKINQPVISKERVNNIKKTTSDTAKNLYSGAKKGGKAAYDKAKELRGTPESRASNRERSAANKKVIASNKLNTAESIKSSGFKPTGKAKRLLDKHSVKEADLTPDLTAALDYLEKNPNPENERRVEELIGKDKSKKKKIQKKKKAYKPKSKSSSDFYEEYEQYL